MDNQATKHWTEDAELLARYALNRVNEVERRTLGEHLSGCEACTAAVRRERELAAGIRLFGKEELKLRLRRRLASRETNFLRRYQLASIAAAVIVVFIGLGFFRLYFGSFEWPTKFSSRKIVLKQKSPDSSLIAHEVAPPAGSQGGSKSETQKPSQPSHTGAAGNASGAADHSVVSQLTERNAPSEKAEGTFWLIGKITVIPFALALERGAAGISNAPERNEVDAARGKSVASHRTFAIRKDGLQQKITLSEQSIHSLPKSRLSQHRATEERTIETLVERTPDGLKITMFRDSPLAASEMQHATIEPLSEDSLVVTLGNEQIAYRIPGGWGRAASSKSAIERR